MKLGCSVGWRTGCFGVIPFVVGAGLANLGCGSAGSPHAGSTGDQGPSGNSGAGGNAGGGNGATGATGGGSLSNGGPGSAGSGNGAGTGGSSNGASGADDGGVGASSGGGGASDASSSSSSDGSGGGSSAGDDGGTGGSGGSIPHGACLDGDTAFGTDGKFTVQTMMMGSVNFYVPSVPSGCKVPVIHLSNGTGAVCADYAPALQRLATHGFLTTCYEDTNTGAGTDAMAALASALMNFPDMADMKFGSTGHSQGGQAAFTGLQLAEAKYGSTMIYAGLAMEPASGFGTQPTDGTWQMVYSEIKSPMFMFSGLNTDGLVSQAWVQEAYAALSPTEEAYFWTYQGATHIPVPNNEEEEVSVPWFRWKLLGDQAACKYFKSLPMVDTNWAQVSAKNVEACQ